MSSVMDIFYNMRLLDIIDILIVAFAFYKIMMLIRETRAEQLIKGIIIILVITYFSEWAKLYSINFILKNTISMGVIALLIVFQPELRRGLEYLGRSKFMTKSIAEMQYAELMDTIDHLVDSVAVLSRDKIGALIVMEKDIGVSDIIETGIKIEGKVTSSLLTNIFIPNTPLHDGAVVVRNNTIMAAGCLLPLSDNQNLSKDLGTRHRAALGMAERSDAIVLIVSEETGAISIAKDGKLSRFLDSKTLRRILKEAYKPEKEKKLLKRRRKAKHD